MEVLNLNQLKKLIDIGQLITDLEEGYVLYSEGQVEVPPVGFLNFKDPPGDVHIKYGYIKEDSVYVVKIASGFYNNPKLGISASDGLLLVFSQQTGKLESILLDECYLTDIRTAVGGAIAAKYLAPSNISAMGIVGTGVQARMQLQMLQHVVDCNHCIIWGRNSEKIETMVNDIRQAPDFWSKELTIEATTDVLSGLYNRRYFEDKLFDRLGGAGVYVYDLAFQRYVIEEDIQDYCVMDCPSPYMLHVIPVKKERLNPLPEGYNEMKLYDRLYHLRSDVPAITHIDYSARIQTVHHLVAYT